MEARRGEWLAAIAAAADVDALRRLENALLGRKGEITELVKSVARLPKEERPRAGRAANALKEEIERALAARREELARAALEAELRSRDFDPTEPGPRVLRGSLHPVTVVESEIVDLLGSMGFAWCDGPEVETEFYNFEALNIPPDHPARDAQDTFWLEDGNLLRTHTSPVQIRTLRRMRPPLKVIAPGRTFRQETVDASHEHTFHQVEGLAVDRDVSVAHLVHTMKTMLRGLFEREVEVRLRPGFFPFVEPGFELDMSCILCGGSGCSACKRLGWMELMGCGMVHPRVLEVCEVDPEVYSGFAFGLGLSRVAMLRYGIQDIRYLMGADTRFLGQLDEVPR